MAALWMPPPQMTIFSGVLAAAMVVPGAPPRRGARACARAARAAGAAGSRNAAAELTKAPKSTARRCMQRALE
jgi:hypothetical protein